MGYKDVYESWQAGSRKRSGWSRPSAIDWDTRPPGAVRRQRGRYEWFSDGMVNTCWNAVDRHVEAGRGDQAGDHP